MRISTILLLPFLFLILFSCQRTKEEFSITGIWKFNLRYIYENYGDEDDDYVENEEFFELRGDEFSGSVIAVPYLSGFHNGSYRVEGNQITIKYNYLHGILGREENFKGTIDRHSEQIRGNYQGKLYSHQGTELAWEGIFVAEKIK